MTANIFGKGKSGGYEAEVIEDSVVNGVRLTTLRVRYPRFVHAEFLRHRVFSRGAASSRAIPISRMVQKATVSPVSWGVNQAGMQAGKKMKGWRLWAAKAVWGVLRAINCQGSLLLARLGTHKQIANRVTEPWQWMEEIITGTEWDNFFNLRDHDAAQPEMRVIARLIAQALNNSEAKVKNAGDRNNPDNWHLPYITYWERVKAAESRYDSRGGWYNCLYLAKLSAARCARVSYLNHDGTNPDEAKDLALFAKLTADPHAIHASPMEHQAYSMPVPTQWSRNFRGWRQHRELVEGVDYAS